MQIVHWVYDHIEFLPTYGSVQGSYLTWLSKRGNACDTASLLIALLRAANIHARYVYGTVQMPIDQVINWVGGVTGPDAALQMLGQGGMPHTAVVQGGGIIAVKLEHVWVEAWVDFFPSQGAQHVQGDTWIPLDASFKPYRALPGMALPTAVSFDVSAFLTQATAGATIHPSEGWVQGLNQANINTLLRAYQEQVVSFVTAQKAQATVDDVLGTRQSIPAGRPVLAAGLPYILIVRGATWATLPASLRHHLTLALFVGAGDQALEEPSWPQTLSLPALRARRLGVTYAPATEADRQLMAQAKQQGATTLPAYLLRVRPLLQLDEDTIATGPTDRLGQRQVWQITVQAPLGHNTGTETFLGSAGDEFVVGINGHGLTPAVLEARFARGPSDTAAENLYTLSLCYWILQDVADQMAARGAGVVVQRLPSVGLFTGPLQVQWLFGVPLTGSYQARQMDVPRVLVAVAGSTPAQVVAFRQQSGWQGSSFEGTVLDMVFASPLGSSVSAVQVLEDANAQGIPLYRITAQTWASAWPQLQLDPEVQEEIRTAVETGNTVLIPAREVVHGRWRGIGYVIQDPETGAGAYLIQGGLHGALQEPCQDQPETEPVHQPITGVVFSLLLFIVLVLFMLAIIKWLPTVSPPLTPIIGLLFQVVPAVAASTPADFKELWEHFFEPVWSSPSRLVPRSWGWDEGSWRLFYCSACGTPSSAEKLGDASWC